MRKLCLSLLTSVLFILVFSCAPVRQEAISTADVVGLNETRAWFEATHQPTSSARSDGKDAAYLAEVNIAWEKGKRVETKTNKGFSIPLSHNRVMWGDGDQFREVPPLQLVVMEKNGERYAFLVVLQPDDPQNWSKDPKTFSGKVRVLDWEGHPVKGWVVKNGVIKGRIFTGGAAVKSKNGRACMDFNEDTYECVYQGNWDCKKANPDGVVVYSMTETRSANQTCSQTIYENCKKYVLQEENLVSADVTTVCDTQEEADMYGFMTFEQYTSSYSYNSGSGPNVTTTSSGSIMYIANRKITVDPSITGCNRSIIETLVNDKDIRDRIVDVFAQNFREGSADIKFVQVNNPGAPPAQYIDDRAQLIEINSAFPESTQEYMTSIILHEMIHALITMSSTTQTAPDQLAQHRMIFTNWVEKMANTLQIYYPTLERNDAIALGLGGLKDFVTTDFNAVNQLSVDKYGMTLPQAASRVERFMVKDKGTPCSK